MDIVNNLYHVFPVERTDKDSEKVTNYFSAYNSGISLNQGRPRQPTRYEITGLDLLASVLVKDHLDCLNNLNEKGISDVELLFSFEPPFSFVVNRKFISRVNGRLTEEQQKEFLKWVQYFMNRVYHAENEASIKPVRYNSHRLI